MTRKVTSLAELTVLASDDVLLVSDVSADESKKVEAQNILTGVPVATLVSSINTTDIDNLINLGADSKIKVDADNLISADTGNQVIKGADEKLFVPAASGGGGIERTLLVTTGTASVVNISEINDTNGATYDWFELECPTGLPINTQLLFLNGTTTQQFTAGQSIGLPQVDASTTPVFYSSSNLNNRILSLTGSNVSFNPVDVSVDVIKIKRNGAGDWEIWTDGFRRNRGGGFYALTGISSAPVVTALRLQSASVPSIRVYGVNA